METVLKKSGSCRIDCISLSLKKMPNWTEMSVENRYFTKNIYLDSKNIILKKITSINLVNFKTTT